MGEAPPPIDRALEVHVIIKDGGEEGGVATGLILAAHDTEGHDRGTSAHDHPGDDGVHGPLARRERIDMARLQAEGGGAVVEGNACVRPHYATSEAVGEGAGEG